MPAVTVPTRRLFLAIDLPADLARRLADLSPTGPGVRRVRPESIHLTLHFLGDVAEESIPRLVDALAAVQAAPFAVEIESRGSFPARGHAAVLWVGLRDSPALASLHAACGRVIGGLGLPTESRAFVPHITVARLGPAADGRASAAFLAGPAVEGATIPVERIVLYASELTPTGPRHERLRAMPLRP